MNLRKLHGRVACLLLASATFAHAAGAAETGRPAPGAEILWRFETGG